MSSQNFRIVFDRPDATYAPSEIVTGEVVLNTSQPEKINELRLKGSGMAETCWKESRDVSNTDGSTSSETTWYGTKEHYFKTTNLILGSEDANEPTTLSAGHHSYKFSLQLPANIPCSFEHTYGHIRYVVKAILDRPGRFNHKIDSALNISIPSDLKAKPVFMSSIDDEIEHQFRNFFCISAGLMNINVKSEANKYAPGDSIELKINYDGCSTRVDITEMQLKFVKNFTFHGIGKDKVHASEVLNKVNNTGPFRKRGETLLRIAVPPVTPLNLGHCSIIDGEYAVALYIKVSGLHSKITRSYPVSI